MPEEEKKHIDSGFKVDDGKLQPDKKTGKCPHKDKNGLCGVHGTEMKPFGCIASPFTLNNNNTLIIRNRYSLRKCHGQGLPAYVTFRSSLDLIFGKKESLRICELLEKEKKDVIATITRGNYNKIKYLDSVKHGEQTYEMLSNKEEVMPTWKCGDSNEVLDTIKDEFDFVFSCPPYADLEVYSDDPKDISNMSYEDFLSVYSNIIKKTISKLKKDRFACFVVGEIRNKKGIYRNFINETKKCFIESGANFYNDIILLNVVASASMRAARYFNSGRKVAKIHQNVLVFYKGDPKNIKVNYPKIEIDNIETTS